MEPKGVVSFRHRRSLSSDRFLDVFSPLQTDSLSTVNELNEDELFWTGDSNEQNSCSTSPPDFAKNQSNHRASFLKSEKSGILSALPEDSQKPNCRAIYRRPSIATASSSRMLPEIPEPSLEREYSVSAPPQKFAQSAAMNVPVMAKNVRNAKLDLDDDEEDEMLPPHEIVARGWGKSPKMSFSVLEGEGRTLKGRDLRQVRNAVWRKTGFLG
ncbi:hypothetical protein NMG60_11001495 [Bertholletia excelsa]